MPKKRMSKKLAAYLRGKDFQDFFNGEMDKPLVIEHNRKGIQTWEMTGSGLAFMTDFLDSSGFWPKHSDEARFKYGRDYEHLYDRGGHCLSKKHRSG
jgi:hypothetical protein